MTLTATQVHVLMSIVSVAIAIVIAEIAISGKACVLI